MGRQDKIDELIKQRTLLQQIQETNKNDNQNEINTLVENTKVNQLKIDKQSGIDNIIKGIKKK